MIFTRFIAHIGEISLAVGRRRSIDLFRMVLLECVRTTDVVFQISIFVSLEIVWLYSDEMS